MLGKALGLRKKQKKSASERDATRGADMISQVGDISKMISASGRIGLQSLQNLAKVYNKPQFIRFMEQPSFVGSSIRVGSLSLHSRSRSSELNRTVIFEVEAAEETSSPSETLKHAVYPLVKGEFASGAVNRFSIGRVDGNDMVMPDYAISKEHAFIEIRRGRYLLKDNTSTNGTKLNGKRVEDKPVGLVDGDIVSFARYEFTFLLPESLYDMLKKA